MRDIPEPVLFFLLFLRAKLLHNSEFDSDGGFGLPMAVRIACFLSKHLSLYV